MQPGSSLQFNSSALTLSLASPQYHDLVHFSTSTEHRNPTVDLASSASSRISSVSTSHTPAKTSPDDCRAGELEIPFAYYSTQGSEMSASSHIASGTNADQHGTTPFRLPTAARKSVFHTLYLTEQCTSVTHDPKPKSGEKPALVPAVEDAVEDAPEKHIPTTLLLDSDQYVINHEPSDDNSTLDAPPT